MPTLSSSRRVTVSSMPGPWTKASGLGGKTESQKVREGGGLLKLSLPGEYEANDVTVVRLYDALRDAALVAQLNTGNFKPFAGTTITDIAFDSAGVPIGRPLIFSGCSVVSWDLGDADANDEKPTELSIVWSVTSK